MEVSPKPLTDHTTRISGKHLTYLSSIFSGHEIQLITGLYHGDMSRITSQDLTIDDPCVCFIIRTLIEKPEWAPLPKLNCHADLLKKMETVSSDFPLNTSPTYSGVFIGKSAATAFNLSKGSPEMLAVSVWITLLLKHWDEMVAEGKDHFMYKLLEDEAFSRNLNGLNTIVLNRGWPKKCPPDEERVEFRPPVTGRNIKSLLRHRRASATPSNAQFDNVELQYLLGSFMAYLTTSMRPGNIDMQLTDATRALIIRYLEMHPENAPLPKLKTFEELQTRLAQLDKSRPDEFPFPCKSSKLGVILGRGPTTVNSLKSKSRKHMPAISTWITLVLENMEDLLNEGDQHLLAQVVRDEAISRGLTMNDIFLHNGWPKKTPL
ncbi:hypothetical protein [Neptuniibacter halophilus]|uniref:hypothetical protein n=1 Tax=Neptuniibacter halophilus TaxID=651666 RepID=UPI0025722A42|nr:hypothetical protein [Neptuniibacter halophilus]